MSPSEELIKELGDFGIDANPLIKEVKRYLPTLNDEKLSKAFVFAAAAHRGQMRRENKPYISHPLETAMILAGLHADEDTLIAAILHDVPEDTEKTIEEIETRFGKRVSFLVEGVTKLSKVHYQNNMAQRQVDSLKKLFIHTAQDPRIILIKLADRLHNMRTLNFIEAPEKRTRIASETLEIFVPIANLLGIEEIRSELEDLCLKYLFPDEFKSLSERILNVRLKNQPILDDTIEKVKEELRKDGITAKVIGRQKNIFSIYKKIALQQRRLEEFDNFIALRVLVNDKDDCYKALGLIHSAFKPKTGKFKDYIAMPKVNGYQSLHTTVFGINGYTTEVQIRTNQMHIEAEYGIAAHYFYGTRKNVKSILEEDSRSDWANKIIEMQKEEDYDGNFVEDLKHDIFHDRIFVFTPTGESIDLPAGATCIDFAYEIHSDIGDRALKADVNGDILPMAHELQNGDIVRIIVSDFDKGPERAWLGFVKTNIARNRIREYFRRISQQDKIRTGKNLLQKEMDRAGLGLFKDLPAKKIKEFLNLNEKINSFDDILAGIGEGSIKPIDVLSHIYDQERVTLGAFNFLDRNILRKLPDNGTMVTIRVISKDAVGQLEKILKILSTFKINIIKTQAYMSFFSNHFICKLHVSMNTFNQVSELFENLEQIDGVKKVERLFWHRKAILALGIILTFSVWAMHPFVLAYIMEHLSSDDHPLISSAFLYMGVFMLFAMVFFLKSLTPLSFPELRETRTFWILTYLLNFFALLTMMAEVYFFSINFNWAIVTVLILMIFAYLTYEYVGYRRRS